MSDETFYTELRITKTSTGWECCDGAVCASFPKRKRDPSYYPLDDIMRWVKDRIDPQSEHSRRLRQSAQFRRS